MIDYYLMLPFAEARRERYLREAAEWRQRQLIGDGSINWHGFRRHVGQMIIQAGSHIGDVTLEDCLPRQQQTA